MLGERNGERGLLLGFKKSMEFKDIVKQTNKQTNKNNSHEKLLDYVTKSTMAWECTVVDVGSLLRASCKDHPSFSHGFWTKTKIKLKTKTDM